MIANSIPYPESYEAWLEIRRKGIGGSDVAACLGLSPFRTPLQVYLDKRGELPQQEQSQSAYWGTVLEDTVAKEFERRLGLKVQRLRRVIRAGENGFMIANIDRAVINPNIAGNVRVLDDENKIARNNGMRITTDAILECKTASSFSTDQWGDTQEYEIKTGELVSEHKIPLYYETQVQWYMSITGTKVCYLAVLIGGQDFRIYQIPRNEEVIQAITEKCLHFWKDFVLAGIHPEPICIEDIRRLFKYDNGEMVEADQKAATLIGELIQAKTETKEAKTKEAQLTEQLATLIGPNLGFTIGGEKAATYKEQTRQIFDTNSFKKSHPALYQQYVKESSTRVMKVF